MLLAYTARNVPTLEQVLAVVALVACGERKARIIDVPTAPVEIRSIGAPERRPAEHRGHIASFPIRIENRSSMGIEDVSITVRVLDEDGASIRELHASEQPLGWKRLRSGEVRAWDVVTDVWDELAIERFEVAPRAVRFCDGSTWESDETSVPRNPMVRACPQELPYREAPRAVIRGDRMIGHGFSFAVPEGYDDGDVGGTYYLGGLRRRGAEEAWIGIAPAPPQWIDLDPKAFDADRCRDLLAYNMWTGNLRFDVKRVSPEITTCARYTDEQIQEVAIAAYGDDFIVHCFYPRTVDACLRVASSWRREDVGDGSKRDL